MPIDFHLNDEPAKTEPTKLSFPDVWDYNAFLVALRAWEESARLEGDRRGAAQPVHVARRDGHQGQGEAPHRDR